jgi:outer membrane protein
MNTAINRFALLILGCTLGIRIAMADGTNGLTLLPLSEAEKLALQNHPQISAANYRALAAEEAAKQARAGFFPNVNLVANAVAADSEGTRILAGGLNNPSVFDRIAGGVSVTQLLTDFGHTANLAASSKLHAQAEGQNAKATREQVLLQVDVSYFSALEAQAVLRVAEQTFATRQILLDQVSLLASNQLKSKLDVSFAQVAVEEGRLLLQKARNDTDGAMTSLSTALGYREPRQFQLLEQAQPTDATTNDVSQLVGTALANRPELASLRKEHDAALRYAAAQRDARLPTLQAIGVAGAAPVHDEHLADNYAVGGVQLSLPVFAGGLYAARQHEAELKAQSDAELLRLVEDTVIRDVHLAWLNLNNAVEQRKTSEQLVRHASIAYELADARYKTGSSSIVELSQAQLSLTSAQITEANSRSNVLIQQANLRYQTGMLR